ncbi:hypothetical protein SPKIRA_00230 [Sphingomonas paucimobilis]|nr:hypothetical protein SPKIRA_00230 [Sphingomonas paucimobilis]
MLVSEASGEPVAAVEFCARAVSWAMAGLVVRRPPISAAGRMADAALPRNRAARMTDILVITRYSTLFRDRTVSAKNYWWVELSIAYRDCK